MRARHLGQPADSRRQAGRPGELGLSACGPFDEVEHERAHLVGEHAVAGCRLGLDEDAERGRETGFLLEHPRVLDRGARLVGPVDRDRSRSSCPPSTNEAEHGEHDGGEHERQHGDPGQTAEADDRRLDPTDAGRFGRRRATLAAADDRRRQHDAGDQQGDDADRQQHAEVLHHRHLRRSCTVRKAMTAAIVAATSGGPVCASVSSNGSGSDPACAPPRSGSESGWRTRCRDRSGSAGRRS